MMDHERYRLLTGADPRNPDPELREHRDSCAQCRLYTDRLLKFEARLERALKVDMPARAARRIAGPRRFLALAASVLLGAAVVGGIWLVLPDRSLAADVVTHMAGEPEAWKRTTAVPPPELNAVLRDSKLRLAPDAGIVSYASSCTFRGRKVPHLVVQSDSGPVTVMVLVHEPATRRMQFDERGYRGTIVPVPGHGSIAVLMRASGSDQEEIDRVAAQVLSSITWTGSL